jgi:hypothetical protein
MIVIQLYYRFHVAIIHDRLTTVLKIPRCYMRTTIKHRPSLLGPLNAPKIGGCTEPLVVYRLLVSDKSRWFLYTNWCPDVNEGSTSGL